jgi:hypothetical protein
MAACGGMRLAPGWSSQGDIAVSSSLRLRCIRGQDDFFRGRGFVELEVNTNTTSFQLSKRFLFKIMRKGNSTLLASVKVYIKRGKCHRL